MSLAMFPISRREALVEESGRFKERTSRTAIIAMLLIGIAIIAGADQRGGAVRDLNTPREFPAISSRAEWNQRAREIREQILISCGLWPMPKKTALHARIFDR